MILRPRDRVLAISIALGVAAGLTFRLFTMLKAGETAGWIMTVGFLAFAPFATGYLTIYWLSQSAPRRLWAWLLLPWFPVALTCLIFWAFAIEGLICIVFGLPILLLFSSLGGLTAGLIARKRIGRRVTLPVLIMPLLLMPIESQLAPPIQHRVVANQVRIHAAPATIWRNIASVRAIDRSELRPSWAQAIGFPRPVAATLSHEGVGGVRHATFERGLVFLETVDTWEPEHRLGFSIHADTRNIPPTTLDQHVTVGGRYFDVLHGEYWIEPESDGSAVLHLESEQRISTDFNGYAGFWTEAVMHNLQQSILEVIRRRSEKGE